MARRPQHEAIDWDVIERQYRLGLKSNAVLAAEFGVDASSIGKRAKRLGWVADKASEVAASANALLIRSAAGNSSANSTPTTQEVQAAARATADVVLEHRHGLRRLAAKRDRLLREQEALTINAAALQDLVDALRQPDDQGADRRNDLVQKLIALPQRVERSSPRSTSASAAASARPMASTPRRPRARASRRCWPASAGRSAPHGGVLTVVYFG